MAERGVKPGESAERSPRATSDGSDTDFKNADAAYRALISKSGGLVVNDKKNDKEWTTYLTLEQKVLEGLGAEKGDKHYVSILRIGQAEMAINKLPGARKHITDAMRYFAANESEANNKRLVAAAQLLTKLPA